MVKKFKNAVFNGNQHFDEPITVNGSLKIVGSLSTTSMLVKGQIDVDGDINCDDTIKINGTVMCAGQITGREIYVDGNIRAECLKATEVKLTGKMDIETDITAETIYLEINPKRKQYSIRGVIKGKKITLSMIGFYTKWYSLSGRILSLFNIKKVYKRKFTLKNLQLEADDLFLSSYSPVDDIDFDLNYCIVNVKRIEIIQETPPTPPVPHPRERS